MNVRTSFAVLNWLKYVSVIVAIPVAVWLTISFGWPVWLGVGGAALLPIPVAIYLVLATFATILMGLLLRRSGEALEAVELSRMKSFVDAPPEPLAALNRRLGAIGPPSWGCSAAFGEGSMNHLLDNSASKYCAASRSVFKLKVPGTRLRSGSP